MWVFTVASDTFSALAISLLLFPSTISFSTSSSRGVKSHPACIRKGFRRMAAGDLTPRELDVLKRSSMEKATRKLRVR